MVTRSTGISAAELRAANWRCMEEVIAAENDVMRRLVGFFENQTPFALWPNRIKSALLAGLQYEGSDDIERDKAEHLRRHLFLDAPAPAADAPPCEARLAERVRADLAGLVPFGAGLDILGADEVPCP